MNNKHYDVVFHYKKIYKSKTHAKKLIKMTHFIHNRSALYPHIRSVDPLPHFNQLWRVHNNKSHWPLTYFEGHVVVSWVIFSFSHVFKNVTLDFNVSQLYIAVFIAVLTSSGRVLVALNTSLHRCARHANKDFLNIYVWNVYTFENNTVSLLSSSV
jgi:hypothetical protein